MEQLDGISCLGLLRVLVQDPGLVVWEWALFETLGLSMHIVWSNELRNIEHLFYFNDLLLHEGALLPLSQVYLRLSFLLHLVSELDLVVPDFLLDEVFQVAS